MEGEVDKLKQIKAGIADLDHKLQVAEVQNWDTESVVEDQMTAAKMIRY